MTDDIDFEFAPDDKIDSRAEELVFRLFGITGAWISNEATLDMYTDDYLREDDDGHKIIPLSEIPEDDKALYAEDFKHADNFADMQKRLRAKRDLPEADRDPYAHFMVWYPPYTDAEIEDHQRNLRASLISKIEKEYGISMDGYGDEYLFTYKVADYIDRQLLHQLPNSSSDA